MLLYIKTRSLNKDSQFVVGNSETRFCVLSSPAAILSREYSASAVAMDGNMDNRKTIIHDGNQPMTIQ